MTNGMSSRHRLRPRGRLASVLAAGFALGIGLAACDGGNAFGPVGVAPSIVELDAPDQALAGETVSIFARAQAAVRIDSLVVTVEGGNFSARQLVQGEPRQVDLANLFEFDLPAVSAAGSYVVEAFAVDAQGNVSVAARRTIVISDGTSPTVTITGVPATIGQGGTLEVAASAQDNVELRWLGVRVTGPGGLTLYSDSVSVSGAAAASSFSVAIPSAPVFGEYSVVGFARDTSGNRGTSATATVAVVDAAPPAVTILAPGAASVFVAGDSIVVSARLTDNESVASATFEGIALIGDPQLGTDQTVARFAPVTATLAGSPSDTVVTRVLRFDPESVTAVRPPLAGETLAIVVQSTDASGNVGVDTLQVTLNHDVTSPAVTINTPAELQSIAPETPISVNLTVADNQGPVTTGVNAISIEVKVITGVAADGSVQTSDLVERSDYSLAELGRSGAIVAPFSFNHVTDTIPAITEPRDRQFFIIATVRDVAGNVGADTIRVCQPGSNFPCGTGSGVSVSSDQDQARAAESAARVSGMAMTRIVRRFGAADGAPDPARPTSGTW